MGRFENLKGKRYGKLVVVERADDDNRGKVRWRCLCDCGHEIFVNAYNLKNGHTKSCGCLRAEQATAMFTTHGCSRTRIVNIFNEMKKRCYNPNHKWFSRYGGRGITICDEWRLNPQKFIDWAIANGYDDALTIDRIDNDGDYSPENCRWATHKAQANNRCDNHYLTVDGETHTAKEWAEKVGVNYSTLITRLNRGWDVKKSLNMGV